MAFDFNSVPLHLSGLWPNSIAPVQADFYGLCQSSCYYCFSNLNKLAKEREPNLVNSGPALFRALERHWQDPASLVGWHMRSGYFVAMSNTTDPYQRAEKDHRIAEGFLKWARSHKISVYHQTKGNVLLEEWDRYAPLLDVDRDIVYLSLSMLDDRLRRRYEPGALDVTGRLELVRKLANKGIPVVVACNPYVPAWLPDITSFCRTMKNAGAQALFMFHLHLSRDQAEQIPDFYAKDVEDANLIPAAQAANYKRWLAACDAVGIPLSLAPYWEAYFGYPECSTVPFAPPTAGGRKGFHHLDDFMAEVKHCSDAHGKSPVLFSWYDVENWLERAGVPNLPVRTSEIDSTICNCSEDHKSFRHGVGATAGLRDVLRYLYNTPWLSGRVTWQDPHVRAIYDPADGLYETDAAEDKIAVWLPKLRKESQLRAGWDEFDCAGAAYFGEWVASQQPVKEKAL